MCCRYYMEESPELRPYIEAANRAPLTSNMVAKLGRPLITAGEVRPTNIAAVLAPGKDGKSAVFPMVWGFTNPHSSSPIVNARVESAAEKQMWKESWSRHRCIIPASWYYEWEHLMNQVTGQKKTGDKYMIQPKGASVSYLAGLYHIEEIAGIKVPVFVILTREPSEPIRFIHDRMPVILPKNLVNPWMQIDGKPDEIVKEALTDMIFEKTG